MKCNAKIVKHYKREGTFRVRFQISDLFENISSHNHFKMVGDSSIAALGAGTPSRVRRRMNNELNFPSTLKGSFSVVWTPIFASKYSLESS